MKKLLIIFIFICSANLFAQLDQQNGTVQLKGLERIQELDNEIISPSNFSISENHSLSNLNFGFVPMPTPRYFSDEEEKALDLREKDAGFDRYTVNVEPGFLKEQRQMREAYSTEQNLGSISTGSVLITVMYRDHQTVDGDRVRVRINDIIEMPNAGLEGRWRGFTYKLNDGINKISFEALNMGSAGPNTAAFQIIGDEGQILAQSNWNLTTGAEAIFTVVKE